MTAPSEQAQAHESHFIRGRPGPSDRAPFRWFSEVEFGADVVVYAFTNLYGCSIGSRTRIGTFVEIQRGAAIGSDCKIQSHTFVCDGVTIGDEVFVGHGVTFVNDKYPRAVPAAASDNGHWKPATTTVESGAVIGSGAVILGGVRIGERATVGAGAVVTKDVPAGATVVGNPAEAIGSRTARS